MSKRERDRVVVAFPPEEARFVLDELEREGGGLMAECPPNPLRMKIEGVEVLGIRDAGRIVDLYDEYPFLARPILKKPNPGMWIEVYPETPLAERVFSPTGLGPDVEVTVEREISGVVYEMTVRAGDCEFTLWGLGV